jgi:transposase
MPKTPRRPAPKAPRKETCRKSRSERPAKRKSSGAACLRKPCPEKTGELKVRHAHAAGIDIGSRFHYVAVGQSQEDVRSFESFTPGLRSMIEWLRERGVREVAMESTGIYWLPVFEILADEGFEVILVDAHQTRHVAGRKSDVSDAQWIQQLHTYGLLSAAFRPAEEFCRLRTLVRHRKSLVENGAMHSLHMQKALDEMNLHLHHVLSDITGVSGMAMIDAILSGERDAQRLAAMADRRVKKSRAEIEAALSGNYREQTLFVLRQALESYRHTQRQIAECDRYIEESLAQLSALAGSERVDTIPSEAPLEPCAATSPEVKKKHLVSKKAQKAAQTKCLAAQFAAIIGVDLSAVPGLGILAIFTLLSEIGTDMSKWRHAKAFASWLGLCPNHKISGGRVLSRRSRKVVNRAANILRVAAMVVGRTDTPLGSFFRRKKAQLGAPKATTATARKLACLIYEMIRTQTEYRHLDSSAYQKAYDEHRLKSLRKRAEELGYDLIEREEQQAA